jgi:hypothetical protein
MALAAEGVLVAAVVVALVSGNRNVGLIVLPFFWVFIYVGVLAVSYGMAIIDQRGPVSSNFPRWYRSLWPRGALPILDSWYAIGPMVLLLICPMFMAVMSAIILWLAAAGKLNA